MVNNKKALKLYFIIISLTAIGLAFSDQIFSNYFKDAYQINAFQRGVIEFPREMPGVLGLVVIAFLSFLGDIRISIIAQVLSAIGLLALGLFTPTFGVMLAFLFINSLGMHLFFPLQDGIGMALISGDEVGKRMGQYKAVGTAFSMIASIFVFVGFKYGFLSFTTDIKLIFLLGGVVFIITTILFIKMQNLIKTPIHNDRRLKIIFRKEYKFYYILAIMNGAQKQIMFVYAPWVLIDILGKKVDTIVILSIIGSFLGIFFLQAVGKGLDKFGIKKMLYADALSFILVYVAYGIMAAGFASGYFVTYGLPAIITLGIFILDKLSMQFSMVRIVYLRSICFDTSEITQTLSLGISMDHIVSIICAYFGGVIWITFGPQYIFFLAATLSIVNLVVAKLVIIKE